MMLMNKQKPLKQGILEFNSQECSAQQFLKN